MKSHPSFMALIDEMMTTELPRHTARADKTGITILAGAWREGKARAEGFKTIGVIAPDARPAGSKNKAPFSTLTEAVEYFEGRLGIKESKEKLNRED